MCFKFQLTWSFFPISGTDTDPASLVVVTEIYIHPLFDASSVAHDLAIVETHEEIPFSSKVGPACLPFKYIHNDFVGDIITVLGTSILPLFFFFFIIIFLISFVFEIDLFPPGWGTVNFVGPVSGYLQKSYLKVAPMSRCLRTYSNETDADQLCTYFPKVSSCQVDSGGPLLWSDPTTGKLNVVGVVSNRFVCAESMSFMQTRLATANNMNWIKVILTGE